MIPDGQPGAGQHFLPLENNGKEVDLDLVNNIMREPYADRFRLILNDLGAGLAARGKDLDAIIKRADPALRQTDRVLADARRAEQAARPARRRLRHDPGAARPRAPAHRRVHQQRQHRRARRPPSAARTSRPGFQKFPGALRELRLTMAKLRGFSDQATPVFAEFRAGAPAIARATKALGPFAHAATPSLTASGTAAAKSQQPLVDSDPILRKIRDLAEQGRRPAPRASPRCSRACARPAATSS